MAEGDLGWLPAEVPSGGPALPPAELSRSGAGGVRCLGAPEPWLGQGVEGLGIAGSPPEAVPKERSCRLRSGSVQGCCCSRDGGSAPWGWSSSRGAGVPVVGLQHGRGCPAWGIEDYPAAQPCHESRAWGARHSSSSSSRLFEEAISGRAGNSYHSLLTPGRQEGEPASPPPPHRVPTAPCRGGLCPPSLYHASRAPCGTPKGTMACPKVGDTPSMPTPMPTAALNPMGWLHPCPASAGEEGREWGAPAPFTPTSASVFWGSPRQILSRQDLCDHVNFIFKAPQLCQAMLRS